VLALIGAICFLASLLGVTLGNVNLITLGLLFVALHLAVGGYVGSWIHFGPRA